MSDGDRAPSRSFLMVRSRLRDLADREAFDAWYETDHAPLAARRLKALSGRRFWSVTDAHVHCALYEFTDLATLERAMASKTANWLIAEYDRNWPEPRVTRTREIWADAGPISAPTAPGEAEK